MGRGVRGYRLELIGSMSAIDNKKPPSPFAKVVFFLYNAEGKNSTL